MDRACLQGANTEFKLALVRALDKEAEYEARIQELQAALDALALAPYGPDPATTTASTAADDDGLSAAEDWPGPPVAALFAPEPSDSGYDEAVPATGAAPPAAWPGGGGAGAWRGAKGARAGAEASGGSGSGSSASSLGSLAGLSEPLAAALAAADATLMS
ncbi:hypothetical protein MNEG_10031 [Monoraphidium neglectum]|uniref:Uncharacterized protein n=1 Tax=Monoraphidium neglectum TaxID=145388 RepID=A0A0D2KQN1_9CHLO|nr:hypothetical protein MNEG_10031 [Monoraphidium neglectum]KIY97928.1 hypothetical protein MNEG_10031 [Monoraphidium neglectum]|eukprot:XP_013896948.1 hypothetical protein MNEG_10031 [Monoraphidium neglectum]